MRVPSYCFKSLESIFYFRMRIPTDLQQIFNRTELKKSLRTKNESVAFRRCRQYVAAANTFRLAHSTTVAWLKRWPLPPKKIKLLLQRKNLL